MCIALPLNKKKEQKAYSTLRPQKKVCYSAISFLQD